MNTKFVKIVTVIDPDTGYPCGVEIRKLESGPLVGLDASYLEDIAMTDEQPVSPYDGTPMIVPEDESAGTDAPTYVYLLEATGHDGMTGSQTVTIRNQVVFASREAAESRKENFRQVCIDKHKLSDDDPIEVHAVGLEVID